MGDESHPMNHLFQLLPSGKRLSSTYARTERYKRTFLHSVISLYNSRGFLRHLPASMRSLNVCMYAFLLVVILHCPFIRHSHPYISSIRPLVVHQHNLPECYDYLSHYMIYVYLQTFIFML